MSEDPTGLRAEDCPAQHPVTGSGCTEALGHEGYHRAMGTVRMQWFGEGLEASS